MRKLVVEFVYFTHATSVDNERGVVSGWADMGLSERGRKECAELKRLLQEKAV